MSDETWDDAPCTDCDDTGITYQTERVCSCLAGLAIDELVLGVKKRARAALTANHSAPVVEE